MASKTSILIFYLRLFTNTQQVPRVASWIVLGIVNIGGIILTFFTTFQCDPVPAAFNYYSGLTNCYPMIIVFICSSPMNIVTDLAILLLIIPVLTTITLPKRQKVCLVFTYSLGIFVLIVDIVRVSYLVQTLTGAAKAPGAPFRTYDETRDGSWNTSLTYMWSAVDVNISIVCACIPTLKPLVNKVFPWVILSPGATKSSTTSDTIGGGNRPERGRGRPINESANDLEGSFALPGVGEDVLPTAIVQRQSTLPRTENVRWTKRLRANNTVHFNFVNMKTPGSMTRVSSSESPKYCLGVIVILVLLPGFWSSMLFALNGSFSRRLLRLTVVESISLYSAYFGGGYFFGPLIIGDWMLRRDEHARFQRNTVDRNTVGGFKATFMVGMGIYGLGATIFWPSIITGGFWGLITTNFVVGFGAGVIETAANPFLILCGPRQHAEIRILIAKGFQALGSVLSNVIARKVFDSLKAGADMPGPLSATGLTYVQWISLSPVILCAILGLIYFYISVPEVTDAELENAVEHLPVDAKRAIFGSIRLKTAGIILAVFAQWTFTSSQQSVDAFSEYAMTNSVPGYTPPLSNWTSNLPLSLDNYAIYACSAFALSRFIAALIAWLGIKYPQSRFIPSPRVVLGTFFCICLLTALVCVLLKGSDQRRFICIPLILFAFAGGPIWPLIFAQGLRGQGARTKRASTLLTMAASGPAIWPFVMFAIINSGRSSESLRLAFLVVVCLLLSGLSYPAFLTLVGDARRMVDPSSTKQPIAMEVEMLETANVANEEPENAG